ncbi:MAG: hypothetical protein VX481_02830 [Cyanobacteriota bacterium]|nr:hypothetical protein [Cyanobacteriota bacterium]
MGRKSKRKILGTSGSDELTGTKRKDRIRGYGGDDRILSGEGKDKVWTGEGNDTIVTVDGGKGHVKIMDFEYGDTIEFCGCASTVIEMKGNDAWITKGEDVKAVVKGVDADSLNLDFVNRVITMVSDDPMA